MRIAIQACFVNTFSSVWEYSRAFSASEIDWASVIGPGCPVCGARCGYQEIYPYERVVVDFFPLA
jgi:hypothetical protein